MNGSARVADLGVRDRARQDRAALRPGERHPRPLVGDAGDLDRELRPHRLPVELHVRHDVGGARGRGRDVERVIGEARDRAVVEHHAVLAQHEPVARLADGKPSHRVAVQPVEELGRVGALHVDLAERRDVDQADRFAHAARLAQGRGEQVLAGARVVARPPPEPGVDELGAGRDVPVVHRREPQRTEVRADLAAGERAERDRRVGRPEGRRPDRVDRLVAQVRHQGEADDVAGLALLGAHAERGVALEMLDRLVALAMGERHVVHGDVVLKVDEGLAAPRGRHRPEVEHVADLVVRAGRGCRRPAVAVAGGGCRLRTRLQPGREAGGKRQVARGGPGRALALARLARPEGLDLWVVDRPGAGLAVEMDGGLPAARDRQEVALDAPRAPAAPPSRRPTSTAASFAPPCARVTTWPVRVSIPAARTAGVSGRSGELRASTTAATATPAAWRSSAVR